MDGESVVASAWRPTSVRWVQLFYTDVFGGLNQLDIPRHALEAEMFRTGSPSSTAPPSAGFREIFESDMLLVPDPTTLANDPLEPGGRAHGPVHLRCAPRRLEAIRTSTTRAASRGRRSRCSRRRLRPVVLGTRDRVLRLRRVQLDPILRRRSGTPGRARATSSTSPRRRGSPASGQPTIRFKEGYHRTPPTDSSSACGPRCATFWPTTSTSSMDAHHHEVATASQSELNVRFDELVPMADHIQDVRYVIKNVARRHGKVACLMPKPIYGDNGIGMHTNQSLWTKGKNAFYDPDDEYAEVSQTCRYYIGGLLEHARALCAITNPITNSYRRLVPAYEAPVFIAWSKANRSANVRIPFYHRGSGRGEADRVPHARLRREHLPDRGRARDGGARRDPPEDRAAAPGGREHLQAHPGEAKAAPRSGSCPGPSASRSTASSPTATSSSPRSPASLIDTYVEMKREEQLELNLRPHPYEFYRYFDV